MNLQEQLSRLLSDDLTAAEAQALRTRIATEPEVASEWRAMQDLAFALGELPAEVTPPALREPGGSRPANVVIARLIPWMVAAAAGVLWFLGGSAPDLLLMDGSELVDGEVTVMAGDTRVDVDGVALISVEPPHGAVRVPGPEQQEDPMNGKLIAAGLAGALVTVAVYEGTALISTADGAVPTVVEAGHTSVVGTPRNTPQKVFRPAPPPAGESPDATIERLSGELAEARQALAEAAFEGAMTRGQLQAMQGVPSDWPDDVASTFGPDDFEAELRNRIDGIDDVSIADVDCSEYPCMAAIEYTGGGDGDDWSDSIEEAVGAWANEHLGEKVSMSVNQSRFKSDDGDHRFMIFGAHHSDRDSDVGVRLGYRMDGLVDELGQTLTEQDVDVENE